MFLIYTINIWQFGSANPSCLFSFYNSIQIILGLQQRAVQGMLDFDYMCKRKTPSVAAMIFPYSGNHYVKVYWGTEEMLIPGNKPLSMLKSCDQASLSSQHALRFLLIAFLCFY